MLVLVLPRVSSRVSGFPVASPCLWGKRQNLSFSHVSNCENWRTSRTKCSFGAPTTTLRSFHSTLHTLHSTLHGLHFKNTCEHSGSWAASCFFFRHFELRGGMLAGTVAFLLATQQGGVSGQGGHQLYRWMIGYTTNIYYDVGN